MAKPGHLYLVDTPKGVVEIPTSHRGPSQVEQSLGSPAEMWCEGLLSTHCCHSPSEPNVALRSDGAARRSSNLIGVVSHQKFPLAATPSTCEHQPRIGSVSDQRL